MEFELTKSVKVAFSKTKEEISKNVTLPYFNPKSDTTLQTNASKKGLGAVILQNSKPVMFASKALTGAEKNYQNLERECLAMIRGMDKFHYFLYGKQFTLETDQKPLVSIYKKHMVEILPHAWHTLGTDLFYWNKIDYLVIGDYFSKYLIIRRLPNSSSHAVIKELGLVFTELGRPFVL